MTAAKDQADQALCELCGANPADSKHHLIPRMCHTNKWFRKNFTREEMQAGIMVCRSCHSAINATFPGNQQKTLGKQFCTLEKLLEHPRIAAHVEWARKHPGKQPRKRARGTRRQR